MILLKIKTSIRRLINNFFKTNRTSSYPFISGDSFRAIAQYIYDEHFDFNPKNVQTNDIIYVKGNFLIDFFKNIHPKINNKYILISHNDDEEIKDDYIKFIDDKIIHWFAQNLLIKHEKITPIPIGLQNFFYNHIGKLNYYDQKNLIKDEKILIKYAFSIQSNSERIYAQEELENNDFAKKIIVKNQDEYIEELKKSYYIASPIGVGIDCHRTWEAIYLKVIPIVTRNLMTEYFKNIGLPILLINSWDDIQNFTEDFLKSEYEKISRDSNIAPAFMDYWQKEITKYKKYDR